jgi:hypothetical protein
MIVRMARRKGLVSDEHFSVDGTLIEAWASMKSVRPRDGAGGVGSGKAEVDFKGQRRTGLAPLPRTLVGLGLKPDLELG